MRTRYCIRDMYISDFGDRFSFKSGSHYNPNENVLIWIMLSVCVITRLKVGVGNALCRGGWQ